jgi:hypothetical protein
MSELVQKLSEGEHEIEVSIRPDRTAAALKQCLDKGYVHLKFTQTRGGTDLYVPLDQDATDLSGGDFAGSTGSIKLVGKLNLDYTPVKCIASIDLATLAGRGHLEVVTAG